MGGLEIREATIEDVPFYADIYTAVHPYPVDPVVERYWRAQPQRTYITRHFVVERDGRAIGVAHWEHLSWDVTADRSGVVGGEVLVDVRDEATLGAVLADMERRVVAEGARRVGARSNEGDDVRIRTLVGRGFHEDRRGRRWQLDLVANRARLAAMTEESRARMRDEGIHLVTLADLADPEKYRKVWRMNEEAVADVPTTIPHVNETYEESLLFYRAPDIHEDRCWVACEGDDIVGMSVLAYPPVRGMVGTAWTATARRVRGRGIARALKCETLMQAIALGVDRVRTGNDAANDPILHINATMGYQPVVGGINFLKDV